MFEDNSSIFYNGNQKLKKSGVPVTLNIFQQQEFARCMFDPIYFIRTYVKTVSLDFGLVPFELYPYQDNMITHMAENRFSIFMTSRQMGKTTTAAAYLLHQLIFNKEFRIAILANKGDQSIEVLGRIKAMYEELPLWMQPGVRKWNEKSIFLGNKSRAFCATTSPSSIRGKSINILYIDEFAHIENDVEFYQSTYPVIMSGKTTKVIITSTPNGMNLFYKIWTEAVDLRNDYRALQVFWHEHPDRDASWLEQQERNMPPKQIAQEVHCVTGDTLVNVKCVISGQEFSIAVSDLHSKQTEKEGVVYKVTRSDGLSYVGITVDYKKRIRDHVKSRRFDMGVTGSEILFKGPYSECQRLEEFFINLYDTWKHGLNTTKDGKGRSRTSKFNTFGLKPSEVTKAKISAATSGKRKGRPGPKHSDEQKDRWRQIRKGKVWGPVKLTDSLRSKIVKDFGEFNPTVESISSLLAKKYQRGFLSNDISLGDCRLKSGAPYSKARHFCNLFACRYGMTSNGILRSKILDSYVS